MPNSGMSCQRSSLHKGFSSRQKLKFATCSTVKQSPAEYYSVLTFHPFIISSVCILIVISQYSTQDSLVHCNVPILPLCPHCNFPNQIFPHPSFSAWTSSLFLWYKHEFGALEFYIPGQIFLVDLFCLFWQGTLATVPSTVFLFSQVTQAEWQLHHQGCTLGIFHCREQDVYLFKI